jgi:hypothetical protein
VRNERSGTMSPSRTPPRMRAVPELGSQVATPGGRASLLQPYPPAAAPWLPTPRSPLRHVGWAAKARVVADCWYRKICRRPVPPRYLESQFEPWQKVGCALVGWVGALVLVVLVLAAVHEWINAFDCTIRWFV